MRLMILALALLVAPLAQAEPVDERTARKLLFQSRSFDVAFHRNSGLTETQLGYFELLVSGRDQRRQFGKAAEYYGAMAISPSVFEGAIATLFTAPETVPFGFEVGYHSIAAATEAALSYCNDRVARGQARCVLVAEILPKRYEARALTLSQRATEAFKAYRRADGPKAFARSAVTRSYGLANGPTAVETALADCNSNIGSRARKDCEIVVLDDE